MAYYDAAPTGLTPGYQYIPATPGYQQAPATPAYQQIPRGLVIVPQSQPRQPAIYAMPATPGFPAYHRTPAALTPGFGYPAAYQQPGIQQAPTVLTPDYWTVATPGYATGRTSYPYARTGLTPYPYARTGRTPFPYFNTAQTPQQFVRSNQFSGLPGQSRQTPMPSHQRPGRPGMTPGREPSYFRGFPNRSGQTPAVPAPKSDGLKPPTGLANRPLGTPARPTPGPSRLREVTSAGQMAVDMLEQLKKTGDGKGKQPATGNEPILQDVIKLVVELARSDRRSKECTCGGVGKPPQEHDHGKGVSGDERNTLAEKNIAKGKTAEKKTADAPVDPFIGNVSPDIFEEDEDDNAGTHVTAP
jgi:hypothetical protein